MLFSKICFIDHFRRSMSSLAAQEDVYNTLTKHLQMNFTGINKDHKLIIDTDIAKTPKSYIIENCTLLQNRNISLENIEYIGKCLRVKPSVLRSRIDILKELGVTSIGLIDISRFPMLMLKKLTYFKKMYGIPMIKNPMEVMFSNIGLSSDHFKSKRGQRSSTIRTGHYYKLCMFMYKVSYLNIKNITCSMEKRRRYYSITEVSKLVKLLKKECNIGNEVFQKCPALLNLDVCKVEKFLVEFQSLEIDGMKLPDIIKHHPKLLVYSIDRVKELFNLQQVLHIPALGIRSCPTVLGMDTRKFLQRYSNIGSSNDLGIWVQHPRVISMICRYRSVKKRIEYLHFSNSMNNATIQTYLSPRKHFTRFVQDHSNCLASTKYLKYVLGKELGEANIFVVRRIVKHPHWKYIPLLHMENMLQYLKKHFSVEDICSNIHIILYPRAKVVQILNLVKEEYTSKTGQDFTSKQCLALCLYKLEKKHHFTGDAVWQSVDPDVSDLSLNSFEDIKKDTSDNNAEHGIIRDNECVDINEAAWLEYFLCQ